MYVLYIHVHIKHRRASISLSQSTLKPSWTSSYGSETYHYGWRRNFEDWKENEWKEEKERKKEFELEVISSHRTRRTRVSSAFQIKFNFAFKRADVKQIRGATSPHWSSRMWRRWCSTCSPSQISAKSMNKKDSLWFVLCFQVSFFFSDEWWRGIPEERGGPETRRKSQGAGSGGLEGGAEAALWMILIAVA